MSRFFLTDLWCSERAALAIRGVLLPDVGSVRDQIMHKALRQERLSKIKELEFLAITICTLERSENPALAYMKLKDSLIESVLQIPMQEIRKQEDADRLNKVEFLGKNGLKK